MRIPLKAASIGLLIVPACFNAPDQAQPGDNAVESGDNIDVSISDAALTFRVLSQGTLERQTGLLSPRAAFERGVLPASTETSLASIGRRSRRVRHRGALYIGYPIDLIGQGTTFGGTIIRISDPVNETYGNLKIGGYHRCTAGPSSPATVPITGASAW